MKSFLSGIARELVNLLPVVPAIFWAISFHEFCHGWVALRLGDPTAKEDGRLTLNPLAHFDSLGFICLLLFKFGWAKPVPIDPRYFRRPRRDMVLVSLAGVTGNILSAVLVGFAIKMLMRFAPAAFYSNYGLQLVLYAFVAVNLNFAVFNLLPIPPLDGSRLLYMILPRSALGVVHGLERWGFAVMFVLIYFGVIDRILLPVSGWALRLLFS